MDGLGWFLVSFMEVAGSYVGVVGFFFVNRSYKVEEVFRGKIINIVFILFLNDRGFGIFTRYFVFLF